MKSMLLVVLALVVALSGCQMVLENMFLVRGSVVNESTGQPIVSVEISIPGYQYAELTNSVGDFVMEVPGGTWDLLFQKEGYEEKTVQVTLNSDNPRVDISTSLVPTAGPNDWILGFWVPMDDWFGTEEQKVSWPRSGVVEYPGDGTYVVYQHYDQTEINQIGTWILDGDEVTMDGMPAGTIDKISNDEFYFPLMDVTLLRKGTEPSLFDQDSEEIFQGVWYEESNGEREVKLYDFTATAAGDYVISWETYTGEVCFYAFSSEQDPLHPLEDEPEQFRTVSIEADQMIFLVAFDEGTCRFRIDPSP